MRKTAAFLAALIFTVSCAGALPAVYADEVPAAETSAADTAESPDNQKENDNSGEPGSEQNQEEQPPEEPVNEAEQKRRAFAQSISENAEAAEELYAKLGNREITAADALKNYLSSKEYPAGDEGDRAYVNDLGRLILMKDSVSDEEYESWKKYLDYGMSRNYIFRGFLMSEQFDGFCKAAEIERGDTELENRDKNPDITRFVQRCYGIILSRKADEGGLNTWTGKILSEGMTAAGLAESIVFSDEYKSKNTSDEDYAAMLIRLIKDSEPEEGEAKALYESTLAKGHTRKAVLRRVTLSESFTKLCEEYKIKRGEIEVGGWSTNDDGFKCYYSPDTGLMLKGYDRVNNIDCYFDGNGTLRTDWSDLAKIVDTDSAVYSFSEMTDDAAKLQQQYPSLVRVQSAGVTADFRQIYDIIIGNPDAQIKTVVTAGINGTESGDSRAVMAEAENFLRNYMSGKYAEKSYRELLENNCIHIIPMLNPDGISVAQYGLRGLSDLSLRARVNTIYMLDRKEGRTKDSLDDYLKSWKANGLGTDVAMNLAGAEAADVKRPSFSGYPGAGGMEKEAAAYTSLVKSLENVRTVSYSEFAELPGKNGCAVPCLLAGERENLTETAEKPVSEYVRHLYETVIDRQPDSDEAAFWTERIDSGKCPPAEMIQMFTDGYEYAKRETSDEQFVNTVFKAACGREPSGEEREKYTSMISGGFSRSYVTSRITELSDFAKNCEALGTVPEKTEVKDGWSVTPEGTFYMVNGMRIRNDLRNLEGFTYVFDKKGRLANGYYNIGAARYYTSAGFVFPRNGTVWNVQFRNGSVRNESGRAQSMSVPRDYQFLYNRVICTFDGVKKTVNSSGCGAASASMVIRYFTGEEKYDPEYLFEWAYKNKQYFGYGLAEETITNFLGLAGIKSYWIQPSAEKVAAALREGHPVIALAREGFFTSGGHYIVLTGITNDGYVTVNDPNNSSLTRMEFRLKSILPQIKCFMICGAEKPEEPAEPENPDSSGEK